MEYQGLVELQNVGNADFKGIERLDYRIDDAEPSIIAIVTELVQSQSKNLTFNFDLPPGEHEISVHFGESESRDAIVVEGADISVEIVEHRFKRGGEVEFDLEISNHGELPAKDIALSANWGDTLDDFTDVLAAFDGDEERLMPSLTTISTLPIKVAPGSYRFVFDVSTATVEGHIDNNSASIDLDIEFVDLRVNVVSFESLGWDGGGKTLMAMKFNVENAGVDDSPPFALNLECVGGAVADCDAAAQFQPVPSGESSTRELRTWMPIGETETRIYAVEDDDSFRWGNLNAINYNIEIPDAPDLVWDLRKISEPQVISYWSDGSADVDIDLTFVNNGTVATQTVNIECLDGHAIIEGCGTEFSVAKEVHVYPTVIKQTLRLPPGYTDLRLRYGAESTKSAGATVPERIIGVERDVWECFSDTSFIDLQKSDDDHDEGIGCGGWYTDHIRKWPHGAVIPIWATGNILHVEILKEVLAHLGHFLNLKFEFVPDKDRARFIAYAGVPVEIADEIGYECVNFGGCGGFDRVAADGVVAESGYVIWDKSLSIPDEWNMNWIRSATLHELLHALTGIQHRHHDRTSIMSYDALDYTTIDGMDYGLFKLLAHPLVQPGMSFDEVRELIVFSDELNDPPEPAQLSPQALLRRAAATMIDAGSARFEMEGDWPRCGGNLDFGPATHEIGNLRYGREHWIHFAYGRKNYYIIYEPDDPHDLDEGDLIEYWLNRGK